MLKPNRGLTVVESRWIRSPSHNHTDKLSKTLQKEKMSAISGKETANVTIKTKGNEKRSRFQFILWVSYKVCQRSISFPPQQLRENVRDQGTTFCSIWKAMNSSAEAYYPKNYYNERFAQPAFKVVSEVEQLLLPAILMDQSLLTLRISWRLYSLCQTEDAEWSKTSSSSSDWFWLWEPNLPLPKDRSHPCDDWKLGSVQLWLKKDSIP